MDRPRRPNAVATALYLNAGILLAILVVMLMRPGTPNFLPVAAAAPLGQPIAGGGTVYLMPAQFSANTFGAYVMDIDKQTLCAYQFYPGEKQLRFIAARQFTHDLRMKNFNTLPDPQEIRKMNEAQENGPVGNWQITFQ